MATSLATYIFTGISVVMTKGSATIYRIIALPAQYIFTGLQAIFPTSWKNRTKPITSWVARTKPSPTTTWTSRIKSITNWIPRNRP
jgi:hypothetical protein